MSEGAVELSSNPEDGEETHKCSGNIPLVPLGLRDDLGPGFGKIIDFLGEGLELGGFDQFSA